MQPRITHIVRPLLHALPDYRKDARWIILQNLLYPDPNQVSFYSERGIHPEFFCPITGLIMHSPVRDLETGVVYEKEAHQEYFAESETRNAVDLHRRIDVFLQTYPYFKNIQYLPFELIDQISTASRHGNSTELRSLTKLNLRLLTTPHPESQLLPLHEAILNQQDLDLHVTLLEKYREGLALAVLLAPNEVTYQLPLEMALCSRMSLISILKLIGWMGDAIDSFQLSSPLPEECQEILNHLLLIYTLSCNEKMIQKMISLGADVQAPLPHDQAQWKLILSYAKPEYIQFLINKIMPRPIKEYSSENSSPGSLQLTIVDSSDASYSSDSLSTDVARSTNGAEILSRYETIKSLLAALTSPLLNEKIFSVDNVDVSLKNKAVSRASYFESKPSKLLLLSLTDFFNRSDSSEHTYLGTSENVTQTDLIEGERVSSSCYDMVYRGS